MDNVIAFAICAVVAAVVLWVVFDDPCEEIYGEEEYDEDDDLEPPDARAWRDPWRDGT